MIGPDPAAVASFLQQIGHGIHLCSIKPNENWCLGRWFGEDVSAATAWAVTENDQGKGLYWTVNLVDEGLNKKARKDDIVAARFVHVDIDPPKGGGVFDKVMTQAKLLAHAVPPTIIIDSGGGLQAFWRLAGSASQADVEAINRNVAAKWGGDNCQSIDHLMRLPGTVNYPNAKKRAAGRSTSLAKVIHDADRILH